MESSRILETNVAYSPTHSTGVIYPFSSGLSTTIKPGLSRNIDLALSAEISSLNSILRLSACPTKVGTLTQVADTLTEESSIFIVSAFIFHSSFVSPPSIKTSICGITLKAICLVKFTGGKVACGWNTDFVCSQSSSILFFPPPETDWYVDTTTRLIFAKSCKGFKVTTI